MRTRLSSIAAVAGLLAACSGSSTEDAGDALVTLAIGNVSFSGDIPFESRSVLMRTPRQPVDVVFDHRYPDSSSISVQLLVPLGAFSGPGSYECGSEFEKTELESSYCAIHVNRAFDASTSAHWTTYGYEVAPGVFGPVPGCTITVTAMSPTVTGTVNCPSLPFSSARGASPDVGAALSLTGSWEYPP